MRMSDECASLPPPDPGAPPQLSAALPSPRPIHSTHARSTLVWGGRFANQCLALVGIALLYYDHLLTLPAERARYWTRPLTWPAAFFFANRYLAAGGQVPIAVQLFWHGPLAVRAPLTLPQGVLGSTEWPRQACRVLGLFHQFFAVVSQILVGGAYPVRPSAFRRHNAR